MTERITIRIARAADPAVARLSALDSATPIAGPALVAERDGVPVAAIAFDDGAVVADPFGANADAVALLVERAAQLRGERTGLAAWSWRRGERPVQRTRLERRRRARRPRAIIAAALAR